MIVPRLSNWMTNTRGPIRGEQNGGWGLNWNHVITCHTPYSYQENNQYEEAVRDLERLCQMDRSRGTNYIH